MRGLGGFVLLAGIGVGLFVYFPAPVDRNTSLEHAQLVAASRVAETVRPAAIAPSSVRSPSHVASFSPSVPLSIGQRRSRVATAPVVPVVPAAAPVKIEALPSWQTNVVPAVSVGGPAGSLDPTDPESRYKLVVEIQQQLKRVGCYWGRANGAWNSNTRDAMQSFTTRVNAALPIDKPDYMLLSMLKQHNGRTCGQCAAGEVVGSGGRCVPQAIVAQGRQQGQRKGEPAIAEAAAPEVLPWKAANGGQPATRLYTPLPTSVASTEPLPGRMSIGAPKDFPPAAQAPLIPGTAAGQPGVATAALEPGATPPTSYAPSAVSKPRQAKKSSGSWRRPSAGTPRYNLMLSLGGVY
jgi:hypothetical protein